MPFSELRRRLVDASFATFGDSAIWASVSPDMVQLIGQDVTVRIGADRDEDDRYGRVAMVSRSTIIRVRSWELPAPAIGQLVTILEGRHAGEYEVTARPMLDDKGVWDCSCEAAPS